MTNQIIKCRDDTRPVFFEELDDPPEESGAFRLSERSTCSWAKRDKTFGRKELRSRIEPWLTALVQSEHLSLLVGSGLTHAVHGLATTGTLPGMSRIAFKCLDKEVAEEAKRIARASGRESGNFEDQIRVATELLRGLEIVASANPEDTVTGNQVATLRSDLTTALQSFASSILEGERGLVSGATEERRSTTSSAS